MYKRRVICYHLNDIAPVAVQSRPEAAEDKVSKCMGRCFGIGFLLLRTIRHFAQRILQEMFDCRSNKNRGLTAG